MVPSLAELKTQCRIDGDDLSEEQLLTIYAGAARKNAENFINRKLYESDIPETDVDGMKIDDDVKLALMLLVGHWYENREVVNIGNITTVLPFGFKALLEPYRFIPL